MAKIAHDRARGSTDARPVARGAGWVVEDVVCTCGPRDRPYEERHTCFRIAIVAQGTFQYRGDLDARGVLMTPGSILLGNAGDRFECAHEHGTGDRCLSFGYAPDYFERIAADAGVRGSRPILSALRLPPLRAMSPLVVRAFAGSADRVGSWEELAVRLAADTAQIVRSASRQSRSATPAAAARTARVVREIERRPDSDWTLPALAAEAGLSPYHFLRTFETVTGTTPHRYLLRLRLRNAALRLARGREKVLDVALDSGFGDVSNFNRAFRTEFGCSPRVYRRQDRDPHP